MNNLSISYAGGKELSISERDFFDTLAKQIQKGEKDIPWKSRKKYRMEVSKKAQEYVIRLLDVKSDREIERLKLHSSKTLMELETRLLSELARVMEKQTVQAALDIQKDYKDAQEMARKIDPEDDEFNEEYLKDLRNVALSNVKDVARMKDRNL